MLLPEYCTDALDMVGLALIEYQNVGVGGLLVYTHLHGKGVGNVLAQALIEHARAIEYQSMRLNTSFRRHEVKALYQSFGFRVIEPYYKLPEKLHDWVMFMGGTE